MEGNILKKCSTSTTDGVKKAKKLKRKNIQKKTSVKKEIQKLRKSFKELTRTVKELERNLPTKAALPVKIMKKLRKSFKDMTETVKQVHEDLPVKKEKNKDLVGKKWMTICVKGFDASLPKDDIKTALSNHFGSCGVIAEVFVPTVIKTGASRGFAHVTMTAGDEDKALTLDGSLLGGRRLEVRMATFGDPSNRGCKTCPLVFMEGTEERFRSTSNGRFLSVEVEEALKKISSRTINEEEVQQSMNKANHS